MITRTTTLITLLIATNAAGCYATWDINPMSLHHLDGFPKGEDRDLIARGGERVPFSNDVALNIRMQNGKYVQGLRVQSAYVEDGQLVATEVGDGRVRRVRLTISDVDYVRAEGFQTGKTIAATTGIVVGSGLLITGAVLGVLVLGAMGGIGGGGRPLHVAGKDAPVRANVLLDRTARPSLRDNRGDERTKSHIMMHWAQEASAECASIPAFLALSRDLRLAGAPTKLVEQALRAAREEAIHTDLCTALATMHAPGAIMAQAPPTPSNMDANRQMLLERLELEAFWDGCVAEGIAANVAQRSILFTKNGETRDALQTIARDEHNHAQLSRHILAYCLSAGGRTIRNALIESLEEKRSAEEERMNALAHSEEPSFDEDAAREYGLAAPDIHRNARAEIWESNMRMIRELQ